MSKTSDAELSRLFSRWKSGDPDAVRELVELTYPDLRRAAAGLMRRERLDHTLQATAVVHETFLRLVKMGRLEVEDLPRFLAFSARIMRNILVDHARTKKRLRRGSDRRRVDLAEGDAVPEPVAVAPDEILSLDRALGELETLDPRRAQVVELVLFLGMTAEEAARELGVSGRTVKRDLHLAKAWIGSYLSGHDPRTTA